MKRHILVVDDDVGIQECLQIVLETEGYEVLTARDGMQALEILDTTTPDLIILDLMMPRMNGEELIKILKQQGRHTDLPIILLTADPYVKKHAATMPVNGYLMKPFELLDLLDAVEKTLS